MKDMWATSMKKKQLVIWLSFGICTLSIFFLYSIAKTSIPYQNASMIRASYVPDSVCDFPCMKLKKGGRVFVIRLNDATRYDNRKSFVDGELVTVYVQEDPNPDGSYTAIEVKHDSR